ncbi:hypothetical protein [Streptomyces griseus]|uniref:hypothetical protein n=1 Tax=Streptomyces griseus TaxID=1911 RepID=UPI00364142AF
MQIQVFDGDRVFLIRINLTERIWHMIAPLVGESLHITGEPSPEWDRELTEQSTARLREGLESPIQTLLTCSPDRHRRRGFGKVQREVLGERIWLDPRDTRDGEIQRLSGILASLKHASSFPLMLFTMPKLSSVEHRLAWLLREEADGFPANEVPSRVLRRLQEMQNLGLSEEVKNSLARDADRVALGELTQDAVARLHEWRLLQRTPDSKIRATQKLQVVLI